MNVIKSAKILLLLLIVLGAASQADAREIKTTQSNWTKIKEIFR